jgi:Family of unknown function (DUF6332)
VVRHSARADHEAVVVEITYALLSSAVLGLVVGVGAFVTLSVIGVGGQSDLDAHVAVLLASACWVGRTLVVLLRFDLTRRSGGLS